MYGIPFTKFLFSFLIFINVTMPASAQSEKIIVWKGIRLHTMEHCKITTKGQMMVVDGHLTGMVEHQPVNIHYTIELDDRYEIHSVRLLADYKEPMEVAMLRKNKKWYDLHGRHLEQFDGCDDIDIAVTPYTNTIPIRRLNLKLEASREIQVIYIDPIRKKVSKTRQRYTHVQKGKYRYENLDSGFTSDVFTDQDGIVKIYPGIWEMIYPENADPVFQSN